MSASSKGYDLCEKTLSETFCEKYHTSQSQTPEHHICVAVDSVKTTMEIESFVPVPYYWQWKYWHQGDRFHTLSVIDYGTSKKTQKTPFLHVPMVWLLDEIIIVFNCKCAYWSVRHIQLTVSTTSCMYFKILILQVDLPPSTVISCLWFIIYVPMYTCINTQFPLCGCFDFDISKRQMHWNVLFISNVSPMALKHITYFSPKLLRGWRYFHFVRPVLDTKSIDLISSSRL